MGLIFNPFTGQLDFAGMDQTTADARYARLASANIFSVNGAASTPASSLTGIPFTGGTATTTKPIFLLEPAGTTSTGWSTAGTMFGVNAASGFLGNLIDLQVATTPVFKASYNGVDYADYYFRNARMRADQYGQFYMEGNTYVGSLSGGGNAIILLNGSSLGFSPLGPGAILDLRTYANYELSISAGVNATKSYLYGTRTDASNYERLSFITVAGAYSIKPEAAGTGTLRTLEISGLPTSSAGLASGTLWNNLGIVNVA